MAPEQSQVETLEAPSRRSSIRTRRTATPFSGSSQEGSQTVVGEMADVSPSEHILATTGIWVDHPPLAPIQAAAMETSVPTETQGIFEYLAVASSRASASRPPRIVDKFGADTLAVIESEPEKLASLKGMTLKKSPGDSGGVSPEGGNAAAYGVSGTVSASRLHRSCPVAALADRAIDILRADPYLLLNEDVGAPLRRRGQDRRRLRHRRRRPAAGGGRSAIPP